MLRARYGAIQSAPSERLPTVELHHYRGRAVPLILGLPGRLSITERISYRRDTYGYLSP